MSRETVPVSAIKARLPKLIPCLTKFLCLTPFTEYERKFGFNQLTPFDGSEGSTVGYTKFLHDNRIPFSHLLLIAQLALTAGIQTHGAYFAEFVYTTNQGYRLSNGLAHSLLNPVFNPNIFFPPITEVDRKETKAINMMGT